MINGANDIKEIKKSRSIKNQHPCFGAAKNKGRIHLPLCPACNLECAFCRRSISPDEERPGVSAFILQASSAADYVGRALALSGSLSVVGVAGPGDCLVGDSMFRAFREISHAYPKLLKCISTNGLLLAERSDELIDVGIDTLTVTVNAVRPDILTEIVPAIHYEGVRITGEDAAEILIENQLRGIAKMAGAGVTIKVNSVFVPELNGAHIPEIARAVRGAGAEIYNIIPLIPQHRMSGYKAPGCEALDAVRNEAGRYIDVFRHCQHCRADAVGIPGISELSGVLAAGGLNETDGIYMQAEDVFSHG